MSARSDHAPLTLDTLAALPLPAAGLRIPYGPLPEQFGELRLPAGAGPFPLMVVIHGGCWRNRHSLEYITRLSHWLGAEHGLATWTIEYRRLGDAGGGWPGTHQDVAAATDFVRTLATRHPLDLQRLYVAGHSAGGQLALWLASRHRLAADSTLFVADPLKVHGVLGLAAISDLDTYRIGPPDSCHAAVEPLLGGTPDTHPQRYAETSPLRRLPVGVPTVFVQGALDPVVSEASVRHFIERALAAGDRCELFVLPDCAHFEPSVPHPRSIAALSASLAWLAQAARRP